MNSVRSLLLIAAMGMSACGGCASHGGVPAASAAQSDSSQDSLTRLKDGNARFVADSPTHPRQDQARRTATDVGGQQPFAAVLACADSRVGPELVFDQGMGDLFVVRVAGNVAASNEIGSIEYAVEHLHAPLVVVLGHSSCGAVSAAIAGGPLPEHIAGLVEPIKPAVELAHGANASLTGNALLAAAVKWNVQVQMQNLLTRSEIVREHIEAGKLQIVGGVYDIGTGKIEWLGQAPHQAKLLHDQATSQPSTGSTTSPELLQK